MRATRPLQSTHDLPLSSDQPDTNGGEWSHLQALQAELREVAKEQRRASGEPAPAQARPGFLAGVVHAPVPSKPGAAPSPVATHVASDAFRAVASWEAVTWDLGGKVK